MNSEHRNLYLAVIGGLVLLLIIMMVTFDYSKQNAEADKKANELIELYDAAGLTTPVDRKQITRVLGDDAAVVCEPIANGVDLGTLKTRLGVGGEFYFRATDVDEQALAGLAAIVAVYCPAELPDIKDFLDGFDFEDVLEN
jgi:hypothetical protein